MHNIDQHLNVFDVDGHEMESLLIGESQNDKNPTTQKYTVNRISRLKKPKTRTGKSKDHKLLTVIDISTKSRFDSLYKNAEKIQQKLSQERTRQEQNKLIE